MKLRNRLSEEKPIQKCSSRKVQGGGRTLTGCSDICVCMDMYVYVYVCVYFCMCLCICIFVSLLACYLQLKPNKCNKLKRRICDRIGHKQGNKCND